MRLGGVVRLEDVQCVGGEQHGHEAVVVNPGTAELGSTAPSSSCSAAVLRSPGGARESGERGSEGRGESGGEVRREWPRVGIK